VLRPYDQCAIIYYHNPGLDVRLGLTDEIVRSVLPKRERSNAVIIPASWLGRKPNMALSIFWLCAVESPIIQS